jgi:hypothetical protein
VGRDTATSQAGVAAFEAAQESSVAKIERLATLASLLLGERWQVPLARLVDRDERLVRRWTAGERPVPAWVLETLADGLRRRRDEIGAALRDQDG